MVQALTTFINHVESDGGRGCRIFHDFHAEGIVNSLTTWTNKYCLNSKNKNLLSFDKNVQIFEKETKVKVVFRVWATRVSKNPKKYHVIYGDNDNFITNYKKKLRILLKSKNGKVL